MPTRKSLAYFLINVTLYKNSYLVCFMSKQKKRIALTVSDDMYFVLDKLSDLTEQPKTKIIMDMLEQYIPVLQQTVEALEQIRDNKEDALSIVQKFASDLLLDGNEKLGQVATEVKNLK